jgi:hypothetical protein
MISLVDDVDAGQLTEWVICDSFPAGSSEYWLHCPTCHCILFRLTRKTWYAKRLSVIKIAFIEAGST